MKATRENILAILRAAGFFQADSSRKRYVSPGFDLYGPDGVYLLAYYGGSDAPPDPNKPTAEPQAPDARSLEYKTALAPYFTVVRRGPKIIEIFDGIEES